MKTFFAIFFSLVIYSTSYADSLATKSLWTPQGTVGLNVSQMSLTNWAQGGDALFL